VAAAFVHPNVVTVYDFGVADAARAFLVMELLEGATLRDALVRQPRFSPARALAVMRDLCAAMEAAHRRQLLHRDLKPENIFLVNDGVREVGKVLDFGVARALNDARDLISDGSALVGTLRYMAPAQLGGDAAHAGGDVWALGIIAYEMLAGAHPFAQFATGPFGVMPADYGNALDFALDDAPASWRAFFARALALDARQRPASPANLFADLERALA